MDQLKLKPHNQKHGFTISGIKSSKYITCKYTYASDWITYTNIQKQTYHQPGPRDKHRHQNWYPGLVQVWLWRADPLEGRNCCSCRESHFPCNLQLYAAGPFSGDWPQLVHLWQTIILLTKDIHRIIVSMLSSRRNHIHIALCDCQIPYPILYLSISSLFTSFSFCHVSPPAPGTPLRLAWGVSHIAPVLSSLH